ncbi:MAG: MFS transporter [Arcanobacterium sp.]|nr:MFS transporter [Arcanobacterium sp.]
MLKSLTQERRAQDLTRAHSIFLLILVSMGSSIIYSPAYLWYVFDKPLGDAMIAAGISSANTVQTDLGTFLSAYAWTALVCYLPSGIIADRVRVRTLGWVGFCSTALLTWCYAIFPSRTTIMMIFIGMGITTILIWWGIRYKLVRLISQEDTYSRNIGLSYGIYGAAALLVGLINTWVATTFVANQIMPMRYVLIILGCIIMVLGILSYLFIPKFEGEFDTSGGGFNVKQVGAALSHPVVWLSALTLFFVYFFYTGVTQTTGYMSDVMGASVGIVSIVALVRTYGITLLSGPLFGAIAHKTGSPSRVIAVGSVVVALGLTGFIFMPGKAGFAVVAAALAILLGFLANGVFGIVSSQLTEGRVPLAIFGTATGLLSVIGFLPDTFSYRWFGSIRDANVDTPEVAYGQIFTILAASAVLAAVFAALLVIYVKKHPAVAEEVELEEVSSEA